MIENLLYFLLFLIGFLGFRIFRLEDKIRLFEQPEQPNYEDLYRIWYETAESMFEAGTIRPKPDYHGYRCELITDMFFKLVPGAQEHLSINLDECKKNDVFYNISQSEDFINETSNIRQ